MRYNKKGFTLIELIVVIAILGILAAVLVPTIASYVNDANMSVAQKNGHEVLTVCNRIVTRISIGDITTIDAEAISNESGISIQEGDEAVNNAIVVNIDSNLHQKIYSMKGGQLATWERGTGWTYTSSGIGSGGDEEEDDGLPDLGEPEIPEGDTTSGLAFTLNGATYNVRKGTASSSAVILPSSYSGTSVTGITNQGFKNMTALQSINIPSGYTYMGVDAFSGCTNLRSISLPSGLTMLEVKTFNGCTSLASINVPEGVTIIKASAFYGCTSLTTVILPASLVSTDNAVFMNCSSLQSVYLKRTSDQTVTALGPSLFIGCPASLKIYVPMDSLDAYKSRNAIYSDKFVGY